ncbi:thiamine diphosphokinase [Neobacillus massiliamazoniensis]|uniref:Thiamine diphosphokinase n=1 Tax=Neobacillus massiliamazoniensis TaxID=1499688 RepID=A0A0U1NR60_9BACI|nr:thiamine diphosphokinase [Neobacillus massiliamazoniensis]CRK80529.1 thiamine pyrophosphokinase [Neobacillus massiliamazoniensis]
MIINIVAGGPEDLLPNLNDYNEDQASWVGVDRGVFNLLKRGIKPTIAFGDFDSVTIEELKFIESQVKELKRYQPEKNETDMELALNWATEQKPEAIRLFGASGGRLDHFLANVQLLIPQLLKKFPIDISLIDRSNLLYLKAPGKHKITKMKNQKYISFIPIIKEVPDLTLEGFKYPLKNRHISIGSTLCISNELISDYGTFSFSEGILLVIRSRD